MIHNVKEAIEKQCIIIKKVLHSFVCKTIAALHEWTFQCILKETKEQLHDRKISVLGFIGEANKPSMPYHYTVMAQ